MVLAHVRKSLLENLIQIDEVRSGGSYLSHNDLRLHFGLEKRTKVNLIEVRWPSGTVDKLADVSVNTILTVKEGQGAVEKKDFNGSPDGRFQPYATLTSSTEPSGQLITSLSFLLNSR